MRNRLSKPIMVISIIIISILFSCATTEKKQTESADDKSFARTEEQFWQLLGKAALSKNTLIHISVSQPRDWKIGDERLQSPSDFPALGLKSDYVAFSHPSSQSVIFVSYIPIVGRSYILENPERFALLYRETHFKNYKRYNIGIIEGTEKFYLKEIGDKSFYVIQNDVFTRLKHKRIIYIFLHISGDMRSLCTFCFSTALKEHIEKSKEFQDFIKMIEGFKINQIDAYEEALYRVDNSLRMGIQEIKWYNAIQDECIEELKNAIAIRPKAWEPRYKLAEIYYSSYLLTDKEEESLSEVEKKAIKQWINIGGRMVPFLPHPINAEAAIREYKEVIKLGCPKEKQNIIEIRIKELQKQ